MEMTPSRVETSDTDVETGTILEEETMEVPIENIPILAFCSNFRKGWKQATCTDMVHVFLSLSFYVCVIMMIFNCAANDNV